MIDKLKEELKKFARNNTGNLIIPIYISGNPAYLIEKKEILSFAFIAKDKVAELKPIDDAVAQVILPQLFGKWTDCTLEDEVLGQEWQYLDWIEEPIGVGVDGFSKVGLAKDGDAVCVVLVNREGDYIYLDSFVGGAKEAFPVTANLSFVQDALDGVTNKIIEYVEKIPKKSGNKEETPLPKEKQG